MNTVSNPIGMIALFLVLHILVPRSDADELAQHVRDHRDEHFVEYLELLRTFISMPNVSADQDDVRKNAEFLIEQFTSRNASMELLEVPGGNPVVYGEIVNPDSDRTICIYAHYDGQPVNASRWLTTKPFEPALYSRSILNEGGPIGWPDPGETIDPDWRVYGRSASDDKAPFIALLAAMDALKEAGVKPSSNIKFFFDGEEEIGSPNMQRVIANNQDKFDDIDLWVFCDGPLHQSREPTLYFGVRGVTAIEITVYGANRNLHSGHYGNWAPNPAFMLSKLISSMKDEDGGVVVKGFYDDVVPLTDAEKQSLAAVPVIDEQLRKELGLVVTENQNQPYLERMQLPSLNVRGLESANVGATARNVVPKEATASIDIRLVKGNRPAKMLQLVEEHIRKEGYFITSVDPTSEERVAHPRIAKVSRRIGYPAAKTNMSHPQVRPLVAKLKKRLPEDRQLLMIPSLGGSLPLYIITDGLKQPLVILPLANHDNNQHAPDENLRLGNLMYGIEAMAAVLTME